VWEDFHEVHDHQQWAHHHSQGSPRAPRRQARRSREFFIQPDGHLAILPKTPASAFRHRSKMQSPASPEEMDASSAVDASRRIMRRYPKALRKLAVWRGINVTFNRKAASQHFRTGLI